MTGPEISPVFFIVLYIWSMAWKGLALWRAGQLRQRNWFVAILVLNTLGVVEMVYLFKFATKPLRMKEIKSWITKN